MPVGILFCEGERGSPDVRVLRSILRGVPIRIQPQGPKYGLGSFIQAYRSAAPALVVAGIRDSDFDRDHPAPGGQVRPWRVDNNQRWLGWYWERTEIESYLLDPIVVQRVLADQAPDPATYQAALAAAFDSLAEYTAARAALSRSRGRFAPLGNRWGDAAGLSNHRLPPQRDEAACRTGISTLVAAYSNRIHAADVLARFDQFLADYRAGGLRRAEPLLHYAGKDVMCAMHASLAQAGFATPGVFREKLLKGLESTIEEVWTWLPEWEALRNSVLSIATNDGPDA